MNRDKEWTSGKKWGWDEKSKKFWQWGQYREGFHVSLVTPVKLFNLSLPLDCKEIQPVHPKGNQSWILIGRTDAEAETSILWPPHAKNWLIGKDPDAGKDWRREEKRTIEDEMVGWHQWLCGHEFEQSPGVGDGQGSLTCCRAWGCSDMTEQLNWTEVNTEI